MAGATDHPSSRHNVSLEWSLRGKREHCFCLQICHADIGSVRFSTNQRAGNLGMSINIWLQS